MHSLDSRIWLLKEPWRAILSDLLSDRSGGEAWVRMLESTLDRDPPPDLGPGLQGLAEHDRGNDASRGKAVHWDHAEEFLTFVDSTQSNSVRLVVFLGYRAPSI